MISTLPTADEISEIANAGQDWSLVHTVFGSRMNPHIFAAQVCEKYGLNDQALSYAEKQQNPGSEQRGYSSPSCLGEAFRISGRCLAALGKTKEAEAAFQSALAKVEGFGYPLLEVLIIADLKKNVLDQTGRSDEASSLLEGSVQRLFGNTPDQQQVTELEAVLGPETLSTLLA